GPGTGGRRAGPAGPRCAPPGRPGPPGARKIDQAVTVNPCRATRVDSRLRRAVRRVPRPRPDPRRPTGGRMPATSPAHQPRRRRRTNRLLAAAGVLTAGALAAAALPGSASAGEHHGGKGGSHGHHHPGRYQDVQLLSFNDLHGNLEPPTGSSGRVTEQQPDGTTKTIDAGGVEYLATHLREARKGNQ